MNMVITGFLGKLEKKASKESVCDSDAEGSIQER